jgi:hypothetical protein
MNEFLAKFDSDQLIGLVAVAGGLLCGIIAILGGIIGGAWQRVRKAEIEAGLKQEMLNRGMSAEEIRTVIDAGTKRSRK